MNPRVFSSVLLLSLASLASLPGCAVEEETGDESDSALGATGLVVAPGTYDSPNGTFRVSPRSHAEDFTGLFSRQSCVGKLRGRTRETSVVAASDSSCEDVSVTRLGDDQLRVRATLHGTVFEEVFARRQLRRAMVGTYRATDGDPAQAATLDVTESEIDVFVATLRSGDQVREAVWRHGEEEAWRQGVVYTTALEQCVLALRLGRKDGAFTVYISPDEYTYMPACPILHGPDGNTFERQFGWFETVK